MQRTRLMRLTISALVALAGAQAIAQSQPPAPGACARTRAEVRNECVEFLRNYRWDESLGDYVPARKGVAKAPANPPEGVMSRAEVRAERDRFMSANRWNEQTSQWEPIAGAPRVISELSRAEAKKETAAFMRTHRWDEASASYVERKGKTK